MRKAEVYYNPKEQDHPYLVKVLVLESGVGIGYTYKGESKRFKERIEALTWAYESADIVWDIEAIKKRGYLK